MTFRINTGEEPARTKSSLVDDTQFVRFSDFTRADRFKRQTIEEIEAIETSEEVDRFLEAETVALDGLHLFDPAMMADVESAADAHKAILKSGGIEADAPRSAPGGTGQQRIGASNGRNMFAIDTGDTGGSQGPWLSWTSNGSAMKGFQPKKWVLRGKDDSGNKQEQMVPAFEQGCVMDIDSLKLGWEKDGAQGQAPERRWSPSVSQSTPRPDDSTKPNSNNSFAWSRALSVRLAIGNGVAATWEQGSFAAYRAFEKLAPKIQAQYPGDGTLPLVKQIGVETMNFNGGGSANIPMLDIVKWVPRPDCLKAEAPVIATSSDPAPQPAAQPAAQPEAAPAADTADLDF